VPPRAGRNLVTRFPERVETGRLVLRRPVEGDLTDIFRIHADPATNRHNPDRPDRDVEESRSTLHAWHTEWVAAGVGYWTVELRDGGRVIGFGGVRRLRGWGDGRVLNVYYRFEPAAWGHGYATELVRAAREAAATACPGMPLVIRTAPTNLPAIRVAERGGFVRRPDLDDGRFIVFADGMPPPGALPSARR
jgi:RimJ/RimL family protein N-acetyltransferase